MSDAGLLSRIEDLEERVGAVEERTQTMQPDLLRALDHNTACGLQLQTLEALAGRLEKVADKLLLVAVELGADE